MYNCQSVKCWGNFWMGNLMDTVSRFKCSFVNSICDHVCFFFVFFWEKLVPLFCGVKWQVFDSFSVFRVVMLFQYRESILLCLFEFVNQNFSIGLYEWHAFLLLFNYFFWLKEWTSKWQDTGQDRKLHNEDSSKFSGPYCSNPEEDLSFGLLVSLCILLSSCNIQAQALDKGQCILHILLL